MRRVAMVAGGTAGHVFPALEVGRTYQWTVPDTQVLFIGTTHGFESRLVPAHGFSLELVPGAPLFGVGAGGKARALAKMLTGARRAAAILRARQIELVIGFGGYSSAGTMLAARLLGVHSAILELNVLPGLTNRLFGRIVDRVFLASEEAASAFAARKTLVTGIPVRPEIVRAGKDRCIDPNGQVRVLITGGSHGSTFLNRHAAELLRSLAARGMQLEIRHQAGARDVDAVKLTYARAGLSATVVPYIEDMGEVYAWAQFAISCAGAGTLAELAASGLPALLVPLKGASEDHQAANAQAFALASNGFWVREDDWQPEPLADRIAELLRHGEDWTAASRRLREMVTSDAAATIVADCETAMRADRAVIRPDQRTAPGT